MGRLNLKPPAPGGTTPRRSEKGLGNNQNDFAAGSTRIPCWKCAFQESRVRRRIVRQENSSRLGRPGLPPGQVLASEHPRVLGGTDLPRGQLGARTPRPKTFLWPGRPRLPPGASHGVRAPARARTPGLAPGATRSSDAASEDFSVARTSKVAPGASPDVRARACPDARTCPVGQPRPLAYLPLSSLSCYIS